MKKCPLPHGPRCIITAEVNGWIRQDTRKRNISQVIRGMWLKKAVENRTSFCPTDEALNILELLEKDDGLSGKGYRQFRRGRQGRWGGGVVQCVRERLDCTALVIRDVAVEGLWVSIKGTDSKANVVMGVYYWPPTQNNSMDKLFYRQLGEIFASVALILKRDFEFPDMS